MRRMRTSSTSAISRHSSDSPKRAISAIFLSDSRTSASNSSGAISRGSFGVRRLDFLVAIVLFEFPHARLALVRVFALRIGPNFAALTHPKLGLRLGGHGRLDGGRTELRGARFRIRGV